MACNTSAWSTAMSSRFGPTWPTVPAAWNVWQAPQWATNSSCPCCCAADSGCSTAPPRGAPFDEVCCSTVAESPPPPQPNAPSAAMTPAARQARAEPVRFPATAHDYPVEAPPCGHLRDSRCVFACTLNYPRRVPDHASEKLEREFLEFAPDAVIGVDENGEI